MNALYPSGLPIAMSLVAYNSILTGFLVFLKRRDRVGFHYFVFSFAVFLWGVGVSFMLNNDLSKDSAEWWGRFGQVVALFIPVTWFHFALVYTNKVNKRKSLLFFFYVLTLLIFPFSFGEYYVTGFKEIIGAKHYPIPGPFYVAFTILFIAIVTLTFSTLFDSWRSERPGERRLDYRNLFFANLYGFLTGSLSFFPVYDVELPQYNLLIMPLWQFLLAYALVRYSLLDIEAMAKAAQREKLATMGLIAASVNHEIRNPLYVVKGLLETYVENEEEGLPHKTPLETSKRALAQVARALDVISKLNRFARPTEEMVSKDSHASIPEALQNVLDVISYEFELDKVHIKNEINPQIPMIQADQRQLEEILFNLIVNACHAIKERDKNQGVRDKGQGGTLEISASCHSEAEGQRISRQRSFASLRMTKPEERKVLIEIKDSGSGISPEQAKHLFEPFHTTKGEKGTGLGLYTTRQLVEGNSGKINVVSRTGKGTTVTINFLSVNEKRVSQESQ